MRLNKMATLQIPRNTMHEGWLDFDNELKNLMVGGLLQIIGFEGKYFLRTFAEKFFHGKSMSFEDREYEHTINEATLSYTIRRQK